MYEISVEMPSRLTLMGLDDRKIIGYRPKLNAEVGSVLSTIVLCQAMYWAQHFGNPFYKFIEPCKHSNYRKGDSWVEELGFTRHEFQFAIKRIGQKLSKKNAEIDYGVFIWYWTDMSRVTWYQVNWKRVNEAFDAVYPVNPESGYTKIQKVDIRNAEKRQYVNPESGFTYKEQRLPENTQRISSSAGARLADPEFNGVAGYREDDDDLYRDLIGLGLPAELAEDVLFRNDRCLVEQKLKDMVLALQKGKVENMTGYAMKVFNGVLYSDKQRERILKRAKIIENGQLRIENAKRQDAASTIKRQDDVSTIEMPEVSEAEKAKYLVELRYNKVLWGIYKERGFESPMVRSHFRVWHADHADSADKCQQIAQINTN